MITADQSRSHHANWGLIITLFVVAAVLLQVTYTVMTATIATLYYQYAFFLDWDGFLYTTTVTVIVFVIFDMLLFAYYRLAGGQGTFKTHSSVLAFVFPKIAIIFGLMFAGFFPLLMNDTMLGNLEGGVLMLLVVLLSAVLIGKSESLVHGISIKRAMVGSVVVSSMVIASLFAVWYVAMAAIFSSLPGAT